MSRLCCRCGADDPLLKAREGDVWLDVCRDCVRPGDTVSLELPAGDAIADVAPRVNA
jgi:NMD protein affecting ribosome stability and mRNA decay